MNTAVQHEPSRACYLRGCNTAACKQANYRYMSQIRLEHHRGQRRRTDATQTRVHVERLLATGWTQAQISRAAGIVHHLVSDVIHGKQTIANKTAYAILSVPISAPPADTRDVDATGTTRRLQALVAIGWPINQLAPQVGIFSTALGNIARGELLTVRRTTADTVALHYQHLICQPGPSNRSRILARNKGWAPPGVWDDIDNPDDIPDWTGHCGTDRGYWMHRHQELPMCARCEEAHQAWMDDHAHLEPQERNRARFRARAAASSREADLAHDARELMRVSGLDTALAAARLGVTRQHLQQALLRHPEIDETPAEQDAAVDAELAA